MFPLRDENPTSRFAWMNWTLIGLNVAVFGYELFLMFSPAPMAFENFINKYSFEPARFFAAPLSAGQLFTIFSAMFMHAGLLHIGGNMLYLWIFGNNIEDRLGSFRYLGFYLLCGIIATIAQALIAPESQIPNLGASGAIAGVLGAYLLLYPRARVITAVWILIIIQLVAMPAWFVIVIWFALQLGQGVGSLGPSVASSGGVAYFAHVGGFLTGLALILPVWFNDRRQPARFVSYR